MQGYYRDQEFMEQINNIIVMALIVCNPLLVVLIILCRCAMESNHLRLEVIILRTNGRQVILGTLLLSIHLNRPFLELYFHYNNNLSSYVIINLGLLSGTQLVSKGFTSSFRF